MTEIEIADGVVLTSDPHSSGIRHPVEYKVVVRPDEVDAVSKGGIIIPEPARDMMRNSVCKGVVEMVSDTAFTFFDAACVSYDEVCESYPTTPRIGDRVLFGKYAGVELKGDDGVIYRIVNDKDIVAVIV